MLGNRVWAIFTFYTKHYILTTTKLATRSYGATENMRMQSAGLENMGPNRGVKKGGMKNAGKDLQGKN